MANIHIEIKGLDKLKDAMKRFPNESKKYMGQAGNEAASRVVFKVRGLKAPPPGGPGAPQAQYWTDRQRRWFFWALSKGEIDVPYRRGQSARSEKSSSKWYARASGYNTEIGNTASYAHWLHGEDQSSYQAARGWRKLKEATEEKIADITKVYQAAVDRLLRDIGL